MKKRATIKDKIVLKATLECVKVQAMEEGEVEKAIQSYIDSKCNCKSKYKC